MERRSRPLSANHRMEATIKEFARPLHAFHRDLAVVLHHVGFTPRRDNALQGDAVRSSRCQCFGGERCRTSSSDR